MKSHVWRPLWVVLGVVALILAVRLVVVPEDFGIGAAGYMYGWHRQGNEQEWLAQPLLHRTVAYCAECHGEKVERQAGSPHRAIQCENCHGPAADHPEAPERLPIDTGRHLCLRCHSWLPYPTSGRREIRGVDPQAHYPEEACVLCHDPHRPNLEEMR